MKYKKIGGLEKEPDFVHEALNAVGAYYDWDTEKSKPFIDWFVHLYKSKQVLNDTLWNVVRRAGGEVVLDDVAGFEGQLAHLEIAIDHEQRTVTVKASLEQNQPPFVGGLN